MRSIRRVVVFAFCSCLSVSMAQSADCNLNGIEDAEEIGDSATDCDGDGLLDECDLVPLLSGSLPIPAESIGVPSAIVALDWNGDQVIDLASISLETHTVSTYVREGRRAKRTGSFVVCEAAVSMVRIDFDADGIDDLAVVCGGEEPALQVVSPWLGGIVTSIPLSIAPTDLVAIDADSDGREDLLVAGLNEVQLLRNAADEEFARVARHEGVGAWRRFAMTAADVDGDGTIDAVIADPEGDRVVLLLGSAEALLSRRVDAPAGAAPISVVAADFDGDGDTDLATANRGSGNLTISRQLEPLQFFPIVFESIEGPMEAAFLLVDDLNLDPYPDIALAGLAPSFRSENLYNWRVRTFVGFPHGGFEDAESFGNYQQYADGDERCNVVTADFFGKGQSMLVTATPGDENI
ncbi:MAG: VCBS repeat-containing protein, partial [Planctomycetota bacterium]